MRTPVRSSQSAQQMRRGGGKTDPAAQQMRRGGEKPTLLHRSQLAPPLPSPRPRWKVGPGTRDTLPFPVPSPKRRLRRDAGADKGRFLYDLASLSAVSQGASFPGIGSLISSIGFNSSAGSANVIFNTLEGSLSRRCLFHHLCPSGAHFKLAKHHLLGKQ